MAWVCLSAKPPIHRKSRSAIRAVAFRRFARQTLQPGQKLADGDVAVEVVAGAAGPRVAQKLRGLDRDASIEPQPKVGRQAGGDCGGRDDIELFLGKTEAREKETLLEVLGQAVAFLAQRDPVGGKRGVQGGLKRVSGHRCVSPAEIPKMAAERTGEEKNP